VDELIREWNALVDALSYEQRVYLKVLGIGPGYLDLRHASGEQVAAAAARLRSAIERARRALQWLDPAALVPMPLQPGAPDPYRAPFRPTHVGRRGGTLVQVIRWVDGGGFVEYRTAADRSGCDAVEFRRLFRPLAGQRTFLQLL